MAEKKRGFSLAAKLTASFVFLIASVSILAFILPHSETRKTLLELTRKQLSGTAATVAAGIDGAEAGSLRPGQEKERAYLQIRDYLRKVRDANPDIKYIYIYRKSPDGGLEFVVDADYGAQADAAKIGEKYGEKNNEMEKGLSEPSADSEFTSDKWGVFLSGYAPVRDAKGAAVCAVGVDMESTRVIERQNYIGLKIYILIGISILIAGAIIALFSLTIIRDIKKLNKAAELVSTGKIESDIDVKRGDEIGELAESFQRMIVSLRIVKMYPDEKNKGK